MARTRKVLCNTEEVCHVWASQSQHEGRCGNIFFENTRIWSYGIHFLMANILTEDDDCEPNTVALINCNEYSTTTARHKQLVRGAIRHLTAYEVPCVNTPLYPSNHTTNATYLYEVALDHIKATQRRIKFWETREDIIAKLNRNIDTYISYCERFNVTVNAEELEDEMYKALLHYDKRKERNEALANRSPEELTEHQRAYRKKQRKKYQGFMDEYAKGESCGYTNNYYLRQDFVRISQYFSDKEVETFKAQRAVAVKGLSKDVIQKWKGHQTLTYIEQQLLREGDTQVRYNEDTDEIQTSLNAYVPRKHGYRLFQMWKHLTNSPEYVLEASKIQYENIGVIRNGIFTPDTRILFGHYTLNCISCITGDIEIGCHTLTGDVCREFVKEMKWE